MHQEYSEKSINVTFRWRLLDQLQFTFSLPNKTFRFLFIFILSLSVLLISYHWFLYGSIPNKVFLTIGLWAVGIPPVLLLFMCITNTFLFWKMNKAQKQVTYDINAIRIYVSDAAGTNIEQQWSSITHFHERRPGYVLEFRPLGARWIPKRILSDEERVRLLTFAQSL